MSPNEGQEEFEEVQSDLKKQEDEVKFLQICVLLMFKLIFFFLHRIVKMKLLNLLMKKLVELRQ